MISLHAIDYSAGYADGVHKDVKKLLKKAKIKVSKKAYTVWIYDDSGNPSALIVIDGDTAYLIVENEIVILKKMATIPEDAKVYYEVDGIPEIVAFENRGEYFKTSFKNMPYIVPLAFFHEEIGLRHFVLVLTDMVELQDEEAKKKKFEEIQKFLEENGLDIGFEYDEFYYFFVEADEELIAELEKENPVLVAGEEVDEDEEEEYEIDHDVEYEDEEGEDEYAITSAEPPSDESIEAPEDEEDEEYSDERLFGDDEGEE